MCTGTSDEGIGGTGKVGDRAVGVHNQHRAPVDRVLRGKGSTGIKTRAAESTGKVDKAVRPRRGRTRYGAAARKKEIGVVCSGSRGGGRDIGSGSNPTSGHSISRAAGTGGEQGEANKARGGAGV